MAIDTAELITPANAPLIVAAGHEAVGLYARFDRTPIAAVRAAHAAALRIFTIWEKGEPTGPGYFTAEKGQADGGAAANWALSVGQPSETTISPCVDYDSNPADVIDYLIAFHSEIRADGYYSLPYGNGATLQYAIDLGYAVGGYLSQSRGFQGYDDFRGKAAIVQGPGFTLAGINCDNDSIQARTIEIGGMSISVTW